jgi:hypothetical protein
VTVRTAHCRAAHSDRLRSVVAVNVDAPVRLHSHCPASDKPYTRSGLPVERESDHLDSNRGSPSELNSSW